MKYVIIILAIIKFADLRGQTTKYDLEVVYSMMYQKDSTDTKSVEKEFTTLLIGSDKSVFCASAYLLMDSAITNEVNRGNKFGPPMSFFQQYGTHNSQVIFKEADEINVYEKASRVPPAVVYHYTEPKSVMQWTITNDTMTIAGIQCQKALTTLGKRKWIAWFAPSVPIPDGPYKFCGLPGLILEAHDMQGYWNFNLASMKQVNRDLKINFLNNKPEPIKNKATFLKLKKYSRDNRFDLMDLGGFTFSNREAIRRDYSEQAKKDNNWIELL